MVSNNASNGSSLWQENENPFAIGDDSSPLSDSDRAEISSAMEKAIAHRDTLMAMRGDPSIDPAVLADALSAVNAGIASLAGGKKSSVSAAISGSSVAVANAKEKIAESAWEQSANVTNYNSSFAISTEDRRFMVSNLGNDFGWANQLSTESQQTLFRDLEIFANSDPQIRSGLTASRAVSEDEQLNQMREEDRARNREAIAEALRSEDPEIRRLAEQARRLTESRTSNSHDYAFAEPWAQYQQAEQQLRNGQISQEDFNQARTNFVRTMNAENEQRAAEFAALDERVMASISAMSPDARQQLTNAYMAANGGRTPTDDQLHQFIRDAEPNPAQVNHALYVVNTRYQELLKEQGLTEESITPEQREQLQKEAIERALPGMTQEQREAYFMATAQARVASAEMAYDMKTWLEKMPPNQRQEVVARLETMFQEGKREETIAMLEQMGGPISESTKKLIMNSENPAQHFSELMENVRQISQAEVGSDAYRAGITSFNKTLATANKVDDFGIFNPKTFTTFSFKEFVLDDAAKANFETVQSITDPNANIQFGTTNSVQFDNLLSANSFTPPASMVAANSSQPIAQQAVSPNLSTLGVTQTDDRIGTAATNMNVRPAQTQAVSFGF
jgi:antirestriction protein